MNLSFPTDNFIEADEIAPIYSVQGDRILKYSVNLQHTGLNEFKTISAPDLLTIEIKIENQCEKWIEKWAKIHEKQKLQSKKEASQAEAESRTEEASELFNQIENILIYTLDIDDTIDWDTLKNKQNFNKKAPKQPKKAPKIPFSQEPDRNDAKYNPKFSLFEKLFSSLKQKKILKMNNLYADDLSKWKNKYNNIKTKNKVIEEDHASSIKEYEKLLKTWEEEKEKFNQKKEIHNNKIDEMKKKYFDKDPNSVLEYCEMVINNSKYPDFISKDFEIDYNDVNNHLIIEYSLPPLEAFPTLKEVKYISTKNDFKETTISQSELNKIFDSTIYKICIRTIHELFEADAAEAVSMVTFNGWINSINPATGNKENTCIVSIQASKEEFSKINLSNVDPKLCFKSLKGIGSSKLFGITPVQPILQIDKTDKRFVQSKDVVDNIDNSTNLAAMNWEDFEQLIRELFEKEFESGGGEVKVTQASKDGGVDAIAFDPDPIRGGKIVIQAKRYTNVVGVSAVRDLYGTVMNEGATKGILVTTADYGPDAYTFAKGKPLTLLNGSNLLHLLQKHGHQAKIDLKEAKKILAEQEKQ